jgi:hypothetical protein
MCVPTSLRCPDRAVREPLAGHGYGLSRGNRFPRLFKVDRGAVLRYLRLRRERERACRNCK